MSMLFYCKITFNGFDPMCHTSVYSRHRVMCQRVFIGTPGDFSLIVYHLVFYKRLVGNTRSVVRFTESSTFLSLSRGWSSSIPPSHHIHDPSVRLRVYQYYVSSFSYSVILLTDTSTRSLYFPYVSSCILWDGRYSTFILVL